MYWDQDWCGGVRLGAETLLQIHGLQGNFKMEVLKWLVDLEAALSGGVVIHIIKVLK